MLNRYDGKCSLCKKPIPAGTEVRYDGETKTIQHWECHENPQPGPDAYRLADRLGFIHVGQDMAPDGLLRKMLPAVGSRAPEAGSGAAPRLFDSVRRMSTSEEE